MRRGQRTTARALHRDDRASPRGTRPEAAEIEVYIEELVLHGFNLADRNAIGEALSQELESLLRGRAAPLRLHALGLSEGGEGALDLDHLNAGSFTLKAHAPAAVVGGQVAHALNGILQSVENKGTDQNGPGHPAPGKTD